MKYFVLLLYCLCSYLPVISQVTVTGAITDNYSHQPVENASIQLKTGQSFYTTSDSLGRFAMSGIYAGNIHLKISHIGYSVVDSVILIRSDTHILISLVPLIQNINEVNVISKRNKQGRVLSIDIISLETKSKSLGEADLFSLLQHKEGIMHTSDINPGLYIRGMPPGNTGIYYGGAELFGTSHLFSIYPQFNSDAIGSATLIKDDVLPQYSGYLSSCLVVEPDHQLYNKFGGSAELGILTSKLSLRIPIIKGKLSWKTSFRRSYFDLISNTYNYFNKSKGSANKLPLYGFYDLNNTIIFRDEKLGLITFDFMNTSDKVKFDNDNMKFASLWNNHIVACKWNKPISSKLDVELLSSFTGFELNADFSNIIQREIRNSISEGSISARVMYKYSQKLNIETGLNYKLEKIDLSVNLLNSSKEKISVSWGVLSKNTSGYASMVFSPIENLKIKAGLKLEKFITDTSFFEPTPFASINYNIKGFNGTFSYSRQLQYQHLYVALGVNLPMNIWYPSGKNVPPEMANHYRFTMEKQINKGLNLNCSLYYIYLTSLTEFLEGNYFTSLNFVTDKGKGFSKGCEIGFIWKIKNIEFEGGATFAQSKRKFPSINEGEWFSPSFDIRNKVDFGIVYRYRNHWIFTLNQFVQDGSIVTLPTSVYISQNGDPVDYNFRVVPVYTSRYNFRMPLMHRMDVSASYNFKWGKQHSIFTFGIFNVYNYQNPYFIYFEKRQQPDLRNFLYTKKKSILPLVPFLNLKVLF